MISELEFAPITPDDLPTAIGIEKEGTDWHESRCRIGTDDFIH